MTVEILHYTPINTLDTALTKCWGSECKSGDAMMERIDRIINKNKHGSIAEHCTVNFDIRGVSRALLQEVARHRMSNISVESTRYTLGRLKTASIRLESDPITCVNGWNYQTVKQFCVLPDDDDDTVIHLASALWSIQKKLLDGKSNDKVKYLLPEAYKTSFTWTLNIRSLMNLFELRTDKSALWEFRQLAHAMFDALPSEYQYLLKGYVKGEHNV